MIDTSQDGKWVARITVSEHISRDAGWWNYAKRNLMSQFMETIMPDMIGDGLHHVMKFDYVVRDLQDYQGKEYLMMCKHSVAKIQNITIPDYRVSYMGYEYKSACRYCGNTLILDKRGGCSACGGPAGGVK